MSKRIIALLLAVIMVFGLAACGQKETTTPEPSTTTAPTTTTTTTTTPVEEPVVVEVDPDAEKYGGDLIIGSGNVSSTMDLYQANGGLGNVRWMMHVYEGLAIMDANGKIYGELCDYEESEDGLTYTFTLRDRYFSNGKKVTMEDVEASIRRKIALLTDEATYNKTWKDATVTFTDNAMTVSFPKYNINFAGIFCATGGEYKIMPKEICEKYPFEGGTETPEGFVWGATAPMINEVEDVIGSNVYMLKEWSGETKIVLEKNPNYEIITEGNEDAIGAGAPKYGFCDTITLAINLDSSSRTAAMLAHEYHEAGIDSSMIDTALSMGIERYNLGTSWTHGIFFNLDESNADSPIADVNVRKAIRAVLDCNAPLLAVCNGMQERVVLEPYAVTSDTVYKSTKMEDSGEWNVANLELARSYLEKSNYNGEPIVYLTHASGNFYNAAMAVIPQLESIGLNIELMAVDNGSHGAMRKDPATGHDIGCWEVQKREDNPVLHSTFVTGSQGWWKSEAKDAAISVMKATPTGSAESIAAYNDYLDAVIDECPYILFGHLIGYGYHWPELHIACNGQTTYYWNDWLEK